VCPRGISARSIVFSILPTHGFDAAVFSLRLAFSFHFCFKEE